MKLVFLLMLLMLVEPAYAQASGTDLAVIMIDEKTEAVLGDFPYDRATLAKGIDAIRIRGGKAVILKFFLDQPKSETGDKALAKAMRKIPVVLQARINSSEKTPKPLPDRFFWHGKKFDPIITGQSGWIPLPLFSEHAACIGFIDSIDPAPAMEFYRGKPVKSLFTCSLEQFAEEHLQVTIHSKTLTIGHQQWPLTDKGNYLFTWPDGVDKIHIISFIDLLQGNVPAEILKGAVVLLGYDGRRMHLLDSPMGRIKAHRLFYHALSSILAAATLGEE